MFPLESVVVLITLCLALLARDWGIVVCKLNRIACIITVCTPDNRNYLFAHVVGWKTIVNVD
jgi:hypothetical protein